MPWKIEIGRASPTSPPPHWKCRISNSGLGFYAETDGLTPDDAFHRAKMEILENMRGNDADLRGEIEIVSNLELLGMAVDLLETLAPKLSEPD